MWSGGLIRCDAVQVQHIIARTDLMDWFFEVSSSVFIFLSNNHPTFSLLRSRVDTFGCALTLSHPSLPDSPPVDMPGLRPRFQSRAIGCALRPDRHSKLIPAICLDWLVSTLQNINCFHELKMQALKNFPHIKCAP